MSGWKYVMLEGVLGMQLPVIFPEILVHADIAKGVFYTTDRSLGLERTVSAGFVDGLLAVNTSGKSESLNLETRAEDASIINTNPYTKGLISPIMVKMEVLLLEQSLDLFQKRLEFLKKAIADI